MIFNKKIKNGSKINRTSHQECIKTFFLLNTFVVYFWEGRRFVSPTGDTGRSRVRSTFLAYTSVK